VPEYRGDASNLSYHLTRESAFAEARKRRRCLVQEYVAGVGRGYYTIASGGEPLLEFTHERLVERDPSGEASVGGARSPYTARVRAVRSASFYTSDADFPSAMRSVEERRRLEEEAREIRRREADWGFIESQPPRLKAALKLYVETGDIRLSSALAGLSLEEFRELLRAAKIPVVA